MSEPTQTVYELLWRNKFLTLTASSLEEMAAMLHAASDELAAMHATGKVTLANPDSVGDDYAYLQTTDPEIAERFGFEEVEWYDDDEDDIDLRDVSPRGGCMADEDDN
jgi:hypothetical protein